jgi:hypothetical protein
MFAGAVPIVIVWLSVAALPALSVAMARTVALALTVNGPVYSVPEAGSLPFVVYRISRIPETSVAASDTETGAVYALDEHAVPLHAIDRAGGVVSLAVTLIVLVNRRVLPALSVAIARTVEVELTVNGPVYSVPDAGSLPFVVYRISRMPEKSQPARDAETGELYGFAEQAVPLHAIETDGSVVSTDPLASASTSAYASIVIEPTAKMPRPMLIAVAPDGIAGLVYVACR